MFAWLVLFLPAACVSGPVVTGADTRPGTTSIETGLSARLALSVDTPLGIRDWTAHTTIAADVTWSSGQQRVDGPVLGADHLHPGDVWTVRATTADQEVSQVLTVPEPPGGNLLVLLIDDVGIDHVGAYHAGTAPPPTPRMDALAAEGVRFTRAYASPVCSATRSLILTGRHARRTGVGWIVDTGDDRGEMPIASTTLPEALWSARGPAWSDAALGKWHLVGPAVADRLTHPNRSGFAHFAGIIGNPRYEAGWGYYHWWRVVDGAQSEVDGYLTTATVDDALEEIRTLPEPWFLYVAFTAAHTPLSVPPAELIGGTVPPDADEDALFDANVEALDTEIGRLLDQMPPEVRADTTIVLMGDNGTPSHAVDPPLDPTLAKHTVHEQGVRVPLIVTGPHVTRPGSVQPSLVHATDLFVLGAELAGVPLTGPDDDLALAADTDVHLDGHPLLPLIVDPDARGRDMVYAEAFFPNGPGPYNTNRRSLRDDRFALVRSGTEEQLFDLGEDPGLDEGPDLLPSLDQGVSAAHARLAARLDELEATLHFEGF
ncbi:MAG: sulfatase-like hydrolase/transferase [Alphaproteobacteria bacterium]|nr:sulfatase-like hydrolase/transferase [Alphaproteobacteria bacterium]MCB9699048.1 sulfatase-like hydrolase/transferase [Alphaproteobacteria bacterium]